MRHGSTQKRDLIRHNENWFSKRLAAKKERRQVRLEIAREALEAEEARSNPYWPFLGPW